MFLGRTISTKLPPGGIIDYTVFGEIEVPFWFKKISLKKSVGRILVVSTDWSYFCANNLLEPIMILWYSYYSILYKIQQDSEDWTSTGTAVRWHLNTVLDLLLIMIWSSYFWHLLALLFCPSLKYHDINFPVHPAGKLEELIARLACLSKP